MLINASQINKVAINATSAANQVDLGVVDIVNGVFLSTQLHNKKVDVAVDIHSAVSSSVLAAKRLGIYTKIDTKSEVYSGLDYRNDYIIYINVANSLGVSTNSRRKAYVPLTVASELQTNTYNLRMSPSLSEAMGTVSMYFKSHIIHGIKVPIDAVVDFETFPLVFFDGSIKIKECDLPKRSAELLPCKVYNIFPIIEQN